MSDKVQQPRGPVVCDWELYTVQKVAGKDLAKINKLATSMGPGKENVDCVTYTVNVLR